MTLAEFGRRVGVSRQMVRKAVRSGRLELGVAYDQRGRPYIADPGEAAREWYNNADPSKVRD